MQFTYEKSRAVRYIGEKVKPDFYSFVRQRTVDRYFLKIGVFNSTGMTDISWQGGLTILFACLPMAIVGLLSALHQAKVAVSGVALVAKRPEESGKAITMAIMVETYAVLALLISFLGVFIPKIV